MNTRSHNLRLVVTAKQVEDVTKAVFHTILFHRTTGKYSYHRQHTGTFSVGTIGYEDIDCSSVDFTYVRCSSADLDQWLSQQVEGFISSLCQQGSTGSGNITLEFYEKRWGRWLFMETVNWEVWHLHLSLAEPTSEQEWQDHQQKLTDTLAETVLYISEVVNKPEYVPRNPTSESLPNVFDVRFSNVQPYLHRVKHEVSKEETMADTVRKLIRNLY